MSKLKEFVEDVHEMYDEENGIHPLASSDEIDDAICMLIVDKRGILHYDAFDRERVRKILQPEYKLFSASA
jgi:hypothetical protein